MILHNNRNAWWSVCREVRWILAGKEGTPQVSCSTGIVSLGSVDFTVLRGVLLERVWYFHMLPPAPEKCASSWRRGGGALKRLTEGACLAYSIP